MIGGFYRIVRNQGLELSVGAGGTVNDERYIGEERNASAEVPGVVRFDVSDIGDGAKARLPVRFLHRMELELITLDCWRTK